MREKPTILHIKESIATLVFIVLMLAIAYLTT